MKTTRRSFLSAAAGALIGLFVRFPRARASSSIKDKGKQHTWLWERTAPAVVPLWKVLEDAEMELAFNPEVKKSWIIELCYLHEHDVWCASFAVVYV